MFKLSKTEWNKVITKCDKLLERVKLTPTTPIAFTEQGVAMLSSVLRSNMAIQMNIEIMRTFVFMRKYALSHKDLTDKLKVFENKYNNKFAVVYEALKYLLDRDKIKLAHNKRRRIGFGQE